MESGAEVNDSTMDAIREHYVVLDRIIKNAAYDGKAVKAEAWEAFQELRALRQEVERLRETNHETDWLNGRMAQLLTSTANALKGEPDELCLHDWSDLPVVAQRLRDTQ